MSTPTRSAVLATLSGDDLLEAAVALSSHIQGLQKILVSGRTATEAAYWQDRLDVAVRAHQIITASRIAT